jgi:hypothetical protein
VQNLLKIQNLPIMASLPTGLNSEEIEQVSCDQSNEPCYEFPNGQKSSVENFSVVEAHVPFCACKHLHSDFPSILDENGQPLAFADDENACGYGCLAEEPLCPVTTKQFEYGATGYANPHLNIPWDTDEAPHFSSDDQFPSLRIGPTVDAPEFLANDADTSDQDGLDFVASDTSKVVLNQIHNERGKYGTIVIGKWEKLESSYQFSLLTAVQVSAEEFKTPSIFQATGVHIPFDAGTASMREGWLSILYFDAEGANTAGKPNFGFTLDQIKGTATVPSWDGTNSGLDQIIYGGIREPFDISRVPGEVEDYRYCDRGPTGFRYYRPNDPQYALDCGGEFLPSTAECPAGDPTVCDFSNIKNFVCDTVQQTSPADPSNPTITSTADTRPVITIIEEMITQHTANPQKNTPEARLRTMYDYLGTLLPSL